MSETIIREARPDDTNIIYSTWLRSYRHHSDFSKHIRTSIYYEWHEKVIDRILRRGAKTAVSCLKDDPGVVIGYLVWEEIEPLNAGPFVIHFAYVKKSFRQMGIMKSLIDHADINLDRQTEFTHYSYEMSWALQRYPELIYNPYLL